MKTFDYPNLASTEVLDQYSNLSPARQVIQVIQKIVKANTRGMSVSARVQAAHDASTTWLLGARSVDLMSSESVSRVALAGDWHGNTLAAAAAFQAAADANAHVLVQMGDLGVWPGQKGQDFLDVLQHLSDGYNLPLVFIDGNHEDFNQLDRIPRHASGLGAVRPGVWHLQRGLVWTWNGRRFGALGGAPSIDKRSRVVNESWWPQEVTTPDDVARLLANVGDTPLDVLLMHDTVSDAPMPSHPSRLPSDVQLDCDMSRQVLAQAAARVRPQLIVHGHYHEFKQYESRYAQVLGLDMELSPGSLVLLHLDAPKPALRSTEVQ